MYMTNKRIMKETKMLIEKHAPIILRELGLEDNDGILERIVVTDKFGSDVPYGQIFYEERGKTHSFTRMVWDQKYEGGSARIEIHPMSFFHYVNKRGDVKKTPVFTRFLGPLFRKAIIHTLAHELRHYWQFYTGKYYEKELLFGGRSIMPYEHKWSERDANSFGAQYAKKSGKIA
jgi:hypothetical protein